MVSPARIVRAGFLVSSKVNAMSSSNDYRPDPQDGFSHDDELLHHVMTQEAEIVVDGDYAGYDYYLDNLCDDDFPDIPVDDQEYGDAYMAVDYCNDCYCE
jgi:hypothetical protein